MLWRQRTDRAYQALEDASLDLATVCELVRLSGRAAAHHALSEVRGLSLGSRTRILNRCSKLSLVAARQPPPPSTSHRDSCGRVLEAPSTEPGDEAVVVEDTGMHGEVLPTSLVLLAALGYRQLAVVKKLGGRDGFATTENLANLTATWGLRARWLYVWGPTRDSCKPGLNPPAARGCAVAKASVTSYRSTLRAASVVLWQSPEYEHKRLRGLYELLNMSGMSEGDGGNQRVLLGCHNYGNCHENLLQYLPALPATLRRRVSYFFWSLRAPSVLPYYLGPLPPGPPQAQHQGGTSPATLLVPGELNLAKRNYGVLKPLVAAGLAANLFGRGLNNETQSRSTMAQVLKVAYPTGKGKAPPTKKQLARAREVQRCRNLDSCEEKSGARLASKMGTVPALPASIALSSGSYEALLKAAANARFVLAPLRSLSTYDPVAKMSAAFNLAVAMGRPIVTNGAHIVQAMGCGGALTFCYMDSACRARLRNATHARHGGRVAAPSHRAAAAAQHYASAEEAFAAIQHMDNAAYNELRKSMVAWRARHFCEVTTALRRQLRNGFNVTEFMQIDKRLNEVHGEARRRNHTL